MNHPDYFIIVYFAVLISYFVWYIYARLVYLKKQKKKENENNELNK